MRVELLQVGFGDALAAGRIVAILPGTTGARMAFSTPTSRLITAARENGKLVDMTSGRRTKAVVVLDTAHIALVAASPRTISRRLGGGAMADGSIEDTVEPEEREG